MNLTDYDSWDTPFAPVTVAAEACAVAPATLRMWFQRKRITLHEMDADFGPAAALPEKRGLPRLLTLRTVLTLAAASPLISRGVDVTDAYNAAKAWTHFGSTSQQGELTRLPGDLFASPDFTYLIHTDKSYGNVVRTSGREANIDFAKLFNDPDPVPYAPAIVWLNRVDKYARLACENYIARAGIT